MTALPRQLAKEYRALLPVIAAAGAAVLMSRLPLGAVGELGAPLFVIAAMSIGSLAIGHEYTTRTLPMLLVQPCRRGRLLLLKLFAAASVIVPMGAALHFSQGRLDPVIRAVIDVTVVLSLSVAPFITMATRSPMAGVVVPMAVPGLLLLAGALSSAPGGTALDIGLLRDRTMLALLRVGALTVAAAGLLLTWRTFTRLEVIDGQRLLSVQLPAVLRQRPRPRPRSVTWVLVAKELHLQELTFVVAGLYLAARIGIALLMTPSVDVDSLIVVLSVFYAAVIAGAAGARVSAEERHLGTHEWQLLMPVSTSQQWALKVAVAIGLALLLGVVLPAALTSVLPGPGIRELAKLGAVAAVLVGVPAMYMSSISSSAVWALLASAPAALAIVVFLNYVGEPVASLSFALTHPRGSTYFSLNARADVALFVFTALLVAALTGVLWAGLVNHRRADRSWRRTAAQACAAAAALVALSAVAGAL